MIIVMKAGASSKDTRTVIRKIKELGYTPHTIYGKTRNVIGAIGDERGKFVLQTLESNGSSRSSSPTSWPAARSRRSLPRSGWRPGSPSGESRSWSSRGPAPWRANAR